MSKQFSNYRYKLQKLFRVHQAFVVIVVVLLVLIGVFTRIMNLNNLPLDQAYLMDQTSELKSVQFNQSAISAIQSLNNSNVVTPGTELPNNRQNPFNE